MKKHWFCQKQHGDYWLLGIWGERRTNFPAPTVAQVTIGLGRWKYQVGWVEG